MMFWSDAHCHLQDAAFRPDLEAILDRASQNGVRRFVINGTCPDDWERVAELAETCSEVLPHFGVHPWKVEKLGDGWEARLRGYLHKFPRAGIGEIGLDTKLTSAPMELQRKVFRCQLDLSRELDRPCTIHLIGAWPELHAELKENPPPRFLLHSFAGSAEQVSAFVDQNAWFSFGGAVLRAPGSEKLRKAIQAVPGDRLLLETDSPFQHPKGREYRQEPAHLLPLAEELARIRGVELLCLRRQTEANLTRFLQLSDSPDVRTGRG